MNTEPNDEPLDPRDDPEDPVDPDIALAVDYLANELSPEQEGQFEERFIEDETFADKVGPLIRIWTTPVDFRAAYEAHVQAEHVRAGHVTVAQYPGEPPPGRVKEPEHDELMLLREKRARRWSHFQEGIKIMYRLAVIFLAFVWPLGIGYFGYNLWTRTLMEVRTGRTRTGTLLNAEQGETAPGEMRTIILRNGTREVLRPGAHSNTQYMGPLAYGARVTLEGEAAFDVSVAERFVEVLTSGGKALLTPGTYAIRCEQGCAAMLVTVGIGYATIRGDTGKAGVSLKDGEHGRVRRGGQPEKVDAGSADGYPLPEVRARGGPGAGDSAPARTSRTPTSSR